MQTPNSGSPDVLASGDAASQAKTKAASGLDSAAAALRSRADTLPGGEKVVSAAHRTADALASTAGYLRDKELKDMMSDVQSFVRNNPGPALIGAAVLGFLVARSLSRE
jgi:hypothetical protein